MSRTSGIATLEREVAAAHVRSLLQDSPIQIASSDAHVVKPWFAGRLEFLARTAYRRPALQCYGPCRNHPAGPMNAPVQNTPIYQALAQAFAAEGVQSCTR